MRNFFLLCFVLCGIAKNTYAQKSDNFCQAVYDPIAANQMVDRKSPGFTEAADPCGNYYANVFFHFIRDDNGATGQSVSNISQYMNLLNGAFNGHNVFFTYKGYDEIKNSTLAATNYNFQANFGNYNTTNNHSDAINVYLFRSDSNFAGGIATTPSNRCAVGGGDINASNFTLSGVLKHEVGHCLNLFHTHHGTDPNDNFPATGPENPNGSNGATTGDLVADTPADRNIQQQNAGNCGPYTMIVGGITYNPDPQNYMSYATANCLSHFSNGQGVRFRDALTNNSTLQPIQQISVSISGPGTLCSSSNYTLLGTPPGGDGHLDDFLQYPSCRRSGNG